MMAHRRGTLIRPSVPIWVFLLGSLMLGAGVDTQTSTAPSPPPRAPAQPIEAEPAHDAAATQRELVDFRRFMKHLMAEAGLPAAREYHSEHFVALGDAGRAFVHSRLVLCERFYQAFFRYFRAKGFAIHEPDRPLMLVVFDGPRGFRAYRGMPSSIHVTGAYDLGTNRLIVYNILNNGERAWAEAGGARRPALARDASRRNSLTIIHEAAHLLCFNTGLLNLDGDVPVCISEGLATLCEAQTGGPWLGIGAINRDRLKPLRGAVNDPDGLIPLDELITDDGAFRGKQGPAIQLMAYCQSWGLTYFLIQKHPSAFRRYLARLARRPFGDTRHRLDDFRATITPDLDQFEYRYRQYLKSLCRGSS